MEKEQVRITGPVAAGVYKRNDYYNQVVYLKATAYEKLTACKDRLETLCRKIRCSAALDCSLILIDRKYKI